MHDTARMALNPYKHTITGDNQWSYTSGSEVTLRLAQLFVQSCSRGKTLIIQLVDCLIFIAGTAYLYFIIILYEALFIFDFVINKGDLDMNYVYDFFNFKSRKWAAKV